MSTELPPDPKESPPAPRPAPREVWKKGGRLLSVLLAVNVLLLACTLISGGAFNKVAVYDTDVFALLTTMLLLAMVWILFYLLGTARCPDGVPYRDAHAGPIWLRGGAEGRRGRRWDGPGWEREAGELSQEPLGAVGGRLLRSVPEGEVRLGEKRKGKSPGKGMRRGLERNFSALSKD